MVAWRSRRNWMGRQLLRTLRRVPQRRLCYLFQSGHHWVPFRRRVRTVSHRSGGWLGSHPCGSRICRSGAVTLRGYKDGDTGNNSPDNIQVLCRRCHMLIDGRLAWISESIQSKQPPKPCVICGREYKPLRHGRCAACAEYFKRHGTEWNLSVRSTKARAIGPVDMLGQGRRS